MTDYLKIGKATELFGRDRRLYRFLEMVPGILSFGTLFVLIIFSYFNPVLVAYFLIAFDVYWLLQVIYLALYLVSSYRKVRKNSKVNWQERVQNLQPSTNFPIEALVNKGYQYTDLRQLVILPTYNEDLEIIRTCLNALLEDGFPTEQMIVAVAMEERAGAEAKERAKVISAEFASKFGRFIITFHPDGIEGELKGKGANQAWCGKQVRAEIVDKENIPYDKILVSVFDIDTIIRPGYFYALSYKFLTIANPYHTSYQPVPVYHNNIWGAPFFSRVAASSNTFWQMMMQIRQEKLVTYSSHSMTWQALVDIGFWSTKMVSEDSRIFFHCLVHYKGDYYVEPLYVMVSMDVTSDKSFMMTARSLYKQQRRWAWGAENVAYLIFNFLKMKPESGPKFNKKRIFSHILIQLYGFHSWGTSALIIAVIGWLPMLLGGDRFNSTVLSGNLPAISSNLMNLAMIGMILSAIVSNLLLPKRPKKYSIWKSVAMVVEWVFVPVTIVIFGAIPCLDAQARLMFGKYMGFWVTPKERRD
ncbi:MAG: glycosyltransferase family 2 protein [Patescibacteria group bacterium]